MWESKGNIPRFPVRATQCDAWKELPNVKDHVEAGRCTSHNVEALHFKGELTVMFVGRDALAIYCSLPLCLLAHI